MPQAIIDGSDLSIGGRAIARRISFDWRGGMRQDHGAIKFQL
jgi:hypothetical protein